jgi:hypothetical protein
MICAIPMPVIQIGRLGAGIEAGDIHHGGAKGTKVSFLCSFGCGYAALGCSSF